MGNNPLINGYRGGEEVRKYYGYGDKRENKSNKYQEKPLGIVHAINLTRDFIGNANFIVFLGDNYLNDESSFLYDAYSLD